MTRQPLVARKVEQLLGHAVVSTSPVAGGDVATAHKVRLSTGTTALVKTLSQAPEGFFTTEADGLRWLAETTVDGGVATPEVLAVDGDCLVLEWVEPGRTGPTIDAATAFGHALARTHAAGAPAYGAQLGGTQHDGYVARLPLPNRTAPTWAEFYAVRRVLPYLKLARDRGAIEEDDAVVVEALVGRLTALLPEEPPARLHGDLWNGNVIWGSDGLVRVVDPAAYGGHREVDLAMLALFGLPQLPRVIEAYEEVTPLSQGWQERVGLHQVFPLLVHACLFGGGYGARAAACAGRYL